VSTRVGAISEATRLSDDEPHYGGARIWRNAGGGFYELCTSGFKVHRTSTDANGLVTAGHCGPVDGVWKSGTIGDTGAYYVGDAKVKADYPEWDAEFLTGSTYRNRIYTSPSQSYRDVTDDRNANSDETVCLSGYRTEEVCNVVATNVDTWVCYSQNVCTYHLSVGNKTNLTGIGRTGDSGGPVYSKNGTSEATVHGTIVALESPTQPTCDDDGDPSDCVFKLVYWQNVVAIKNQLGVTVVHN
jgi:hypothetical protein